MEPIENGVREHEDVEDICKATRIRCSIRWNRTILEVAVAMRVAFVLDSGECFRDGTALAVVIVVSFPSPCKREDNKIAKCRRRKRRRYRQDGLLNRISSKG